MFTPVRKWFKKSVTRRGQEFWRPNRFNLHLDQLEDRTTPAAVLYDLNVTNPATINGATFTHVTSGGGGAGADKFLSLNTDGPTGIEAGFNTNAKPLQLQTKEPTHAIQLSEVPTLNIGGVTYYEFTLDANESDNGGHSYIVLNDLRVYHFPTATLAGYDQATRTLGGQAPLYDLDVYTGNVLTTDNNVLIDGVGSGTYDAAFLVPAIAFTGVPLSDYIYLYSRFGDTSPATTPPIPPSAVADDGFEHWAIDDTAQSPLADLSVNKTDFPDPATPGESITYTITVTNNAVPGRTPITLTSVLLQDTFPSVLSNIQFVPTTGTYNPATGLWTGITLPVGGSITMTVTADIAPDALITLAPGNQMLNTVSVWTTGVVGDANPGNNTDTEPTTLVAEGNLTVTKDDGVTSVVAGQTTVTYTMVITNSGPSTLTSITFQDLVPPELENVTPFDVVGDPDEVFFLTNAATGTYLLSNILLAPGGSITVTFSGRVRADATPGIGELVNTVTVTPPTGTGDTDDDIDDITQLADVSITKTSEDLDEIFAGDNLFYYVTVVNNGPSSLTGVPLSDPFTDLNITNPTWALYSAAGGATSSANSGTGPINVTLTLPVQSSITFRVAWTANPAATPGTVITNVATVTVPPAVDPNQGDNTATHDDTVQPPPQVFTDLQITKGHAPEPAVPGESVTYTIVVSNPAGPNQNPVTNATVYDTFFLNFSEFAGALSWTVISRDGGATNDFDDGTGPLFDNTVDLPVNSSITYQVTGQILSTALGDIMNRVVVATPPGVRDPDLSNNVATDTVTLNPEVDLVLDKDDFQTTAVPGTSVTYTITVTNSGPSTIYSVTLEDTVPAALIPSTVVFSTTDGSIVLHGLNPVTNTHVLIWGGFGPLDPGDTITMTLTGIVAPSATGTITNTATVFPPIDVIERNPDDNTDDDVDTLTPQADIAIVKTNPVAPFDREVPGLPVTYTITVTNAAGPSDLTGVPVNDTFPPELLNVTWTSVAINGASGNTASGSGNIAETVSLPVGSSIIYVITGLLDPTARGTLTNTASAPLPPDVDPNPQNNTDTHVDTLSPQADLGVAKTSNVPSVMVGDTLVYTITVTNFGPSTVDSVTLTETLPPQYQVTGRSVSSGTYNAATGSWTGISFATGQSITLTITGTVTGGAGGTVFNSAVVAPPPDVNDFNNTNDGASLELPVRPRPVIVPGEAPPLPLLPPPEVSKRALLVSTMTSTDPLTGPVRAAVADFNRDGVPDTVVGSAPGMPDLVQVIDGRTGAVLFSTEPFDPTFLGGVFVTTGDLTGDGVPDLVVSPDQGGGPRVQVYDGTNFAKRLDFLGIQAPDFRGGVRIAVGDVTGDGAPELVVAAGYGGGPRVTIWDGLSIRGGAPAPIANFFAFEPELRNGTYVTTGDINGDGFADLIFGAGPGGGPRVTIVSGQTLVTHGSDAAFAAPLANYFAGNVDYRYGVRVAYWDTDGDGEGELVTGSGPGETPPRMWAYQSPAVLSPAGTAPEDLTGLMGDHLLSAVFVG